MIDETRNMNEEKINSAFNNKTKVHITLRNKSWRNGIITYIGADFFIIEDMINGQDPIFFLDLDKIEPFKEDVR